MYPKQIFFGSRVDISPLRSWIGKFNAFQILIYARTGWAYALALGITGVTTLALAVLPGIAMHFGDIVHMTGAFGG